MDALWWKQWHFPNTEHVPCTGLSGRALSCISRVWVFAALPRSSVCGFLQVRILEWVAMPSPGDLPDSGTEPGFPALQVDFFTTWATRGSPVLKRYSYKHHNNSRMGMLLFYPLHWKEASKRQRNGRPEGGREETQELQRSFLSTLFSSFILPLTFLPSFFTFSPFLSIMVQCSLDNALNDTTTL